MEEKTRRLLLLYESQILTRKKIRKLLNADKELKDVQRYSKKELIGFFHFSEPEAERLIRWLRKNPFQAKEAPEATDYRRATIFDTFYPSLLSCIPDPPLVLYLKGNLNLLTHMPSLSVVGTRKPSQEAKDKMMYILSPLIKDDWLVVSGMARGIDSYAHRLACHYNGKTIAVLGSGFAHIYPPENKTLFHHLAHDQLVISEYPPGTPPRRFHFPERNRIISGLTLATLVVEAEVKSGSLITADQALEQGRDVFAIPGSPLSSHAQGVNKLIQQGAKLINCADDIKEEVMKPL